MKRFFLSSLKVMLGATLVCLIIGSAVLVFGGIVATFVALNALNLLISLVGLFLLGIFGALFDEFILS